MPFTAVNRLKNELICAFDFEDANQIRNNPNYEDLACPLCGAKMFPRQGKYYTLHFVHQRQCTSLMERHPESFEHLAGKFFLYNTLKNQLRPYSNVEIKVEYPIKEAGENGRVADVAAIFKTGYILVYECQLSSISPEQLDKRTKDYANAGADVVWFVGKSADTYENREYLTSQFGYYQTIAFSCEDES